MSDSVINEEPPDENEEYAGLDEALDDADALGGGPEGERDLDAELVVDELELEEASARFDDPDEVQPVLSGGMDDPDEPDPDAEEDDFDDHDLAEEPDPDAPGRGGTAAEVVDTAAPLAGEDRASVEDLEKIPDDAPGVDSARW